MAPRIALVHATALAIKPIVGAFARLWPEARLMNLLDDSLSADRAAAGALTPAMIERFGSLARYCFDHGADGILFTCSAFGPAIEAARSIVPVPILKPNEAMLAEALDLAAAGSGRLVLLATFEPSLGSIADELVAIADARTQSIELRSRYIVGAMAALEHGDDAGHDALQRDALEPNVRAVAPDLRAQSLSGVQRRRETHAQPFQRCGVAGRRASRYTGSQSKTSCERSSG